MFRSFLAKTAIASSLLVSLLVPAYVQPAQAQTGERCFRETNQCISGRFRQYWEQNGGLAVFGFPVTAAQNERNRDTGQTYLTQWFERNRFELHPENKAPYDVLLGRLGDDTLQLRGIDWKRDGQAGKPNGCMYFAETGHKVCDQEAGLGFKTYWQTHGLEFDGKRGTSYNESLALFGLPLTEARMETNVSGDQVITQWFERARLEYHPCMLREYRVLLGLLGNDVRSFNAPSGLRSEAPWIRSGNQLMTMTSSLPTLGIAQIGDSPMPSIRVAPNGRTIAFTKLVKTTTPLVYNLVIMDTRTGARSSYELDADTNYWSGVFSPDSQQFAFSLISNGYPTNYQLRVLDLPSGTMNTRLTGSNEPVPVPTVWNSAGLFATTIVYASDAPPLGVFQVDLTRGRLLTITDLPNFGLDVNAGGKAVLVTGEQPLGGSPKMSLSVVDRASNQKTIVPQGQYRIGNVHWSPDGSKIVHTRGVGYSEPISSVRVTNPDGSGEQVLRLEGGAFPGPLHDVAWRNNTTLLLLFSDDGNDQLVVYEVSLNNFTPVAATFIQYTNSFSEFGHEFAYMPR